MTTSTDELISLIDQELSDRDYRITNLLGECEILRAANTRLTSELDTARRVFGSAFCSGFVGKTRPNRPKLSAQEAKDIREAHRGGMKQADLARNYGVNPATISRIVNRTYY